MLTFCNGTGTICHNRNLLINLCETLIWILITEKMAFQFIPNKSLWTVSAKKEKTCEKKVSCKMNAKGKNPDAFS